MPTRFNQTDVGRIKGLAMSGQEYNYYFDADELHRPFLELVRRCTTSSRYVPATQVNSEVARLPSIVPIEPPRQTATQPAVTRPRLPLIELPPPSPEPLEYAPEVRPTAQARKMALDLVKA